MYRSNSDLQYVSLPLLLYSFYCMAIANIGMKVAIAMQRPPIVCILYNRRPLLHYSLFYIIEFNANHFLFFSNILLFVILA